MFTNEHDPMTAPRPMCAPDINVTLVPNQTPSSIMISFSLSLICLCPPRHCGMLTVGVWLPVTIVQSGAIPQNFL